MTIVLLSGWSGAGKDVVGADLVQRHGFRRMAFADALKQLVCDELGLDVAVAHTQAGKAAFVRDGVTLRAELIRRGQELRDQHGADYFARLLADGIGDEPRVVVTDWRFVAELDALQSYRVVCVRVVNGTQEASPVADASDHELDAWPSFDAVVMHDGRTLDSVRRAVDGFMATAFISS